MTAVLRRPAVVATVFAAVFVAMNLFRVDAGLRTVEEFHGQPYVALYGQPQNAAEWLLNQGDGQAFAALAQDPTLDRPEVFVGGEDSAAYRAQRPLLGWVVWASSLGQPAAVPYLLFSWAVIGVGVLVAAVRLLAVDRERWYPLALAVLVLPGVLADLAWSGPEAFATGLALIGVWRWERSDVWGALALLTAATLMRETLLLVPVGLGLSHLWVHRRPNRSLLLLAACPVALAVWWAVVRWRIGAWPAEASQGRLGAPFQGLVESAPGWGPVDVGFAVLAVGLMILAVRERGTDTRADDTLWWILMVHVALALVMGESVWARWEDFGRALLPFYVVAMTLALPRAPMIIPEHTFTQLRGLHR